MIIQLLNMSWIILYNPILNTTTLVMIKTIELTSRYSKFGPRTRANTWPSSPAPHDQGQQPTPEQQLAAKRGCHPRPTAYASTEAAGLGAAGQQLSAQRGSSSFPGLLSAHKGLPRQLLLPTKSTVTASKTHGQQPLPGLLCTCSSGHLMVTQSGIWSRTRFFIIWKCST